MGIMGAEPDFIAGEVQQRELIVEVSDVSVLIGIAIHTAPLIDLVFISLGVVEQVAEELVHGFVLLPGSPEPDYPATSLLSLNVDN